MQFLPCMHPSSLKSAESTYLRFDAEGSPDHPNDSDGRSTHSSFLEHDEASGQQHTYRNAPVASPQTRHREVVFRPARVCIGNPSERKLQEGLDPQVEVVDIFGYLGNNPTEGGWASRVSGQSQLILSCPSPSEREVQWVIWGVHKRNQRACNPRGVCVLLVHTRRDQGPA